MQAFLNKHRAYQDFFNDLGRFTDAITLLLKSRHPHHHIWWRDDMAEPTARWFVERLNKKVYGRRYSGGYNCLAVAVAYERGGLTKRPHFHLAIERPTHLSSQKFHQMIQEIFKRMEWGFGTIHICNYSSASFLRYVCKGDFERFLIGACSRG